MRFFLILFFFPCLLGQVKACNETEVEAWLAEIDAEFRTEMHTVALASYRRKIHLTAGNSERLASLRTKISVKRSNITVRARELLAGCHRGGLRPWNRRQLHRLLNLGDVYSEPESRAALEALTDQMTRLYAAEEVDAWGWNETAWALPQVTHRLSASSDYQEQHYIYAEWHTKLGSALKPLFNQSLHLANEAARKGGFKDLGESWRSFYEAPDIRDQLDKLLIQILPFYEHLHAFMRKNLREVYPGRLDNISSIPPHLLGNLWAQDWENNFGKTVPFPSADSHDVTSEMQRKNFTRQALLKTAEEFFTSLGLPPMPPQFWERVVMERPLNKSMSCHPTAFDYILTLVMCANVDAPALMTVHHEMGHIQYYLAYNHLPIAYRSGANPAFHEAIGDAMALAVATPKRLRALGLLPGNSHNQSYEETINYLFRMALIKLPLLPYAYILDKFRWDLFENKVPYDQWNHHWLALRYQYQGLTKDPERERPELFDAGAKFHVAAGVPYTRYFLSTLLQFQIYQALCNSSSHEGPLHLCDFHGNLKAGARLQKLLRLGSSLHWKKWLLDIFKVLKRLTGSKEMSAEPLLEYFRPLIVWLEEANRGDCFGWGYEWPEHVQSLLPQPRC